MADLQNSKKSTQSFSGALLEILIGDPVGPDRKACETMKRSARIAYAAFCLGGLCTEDNSSVSRKQWDSFSDAQVCHLTSQWLISFGIGHGIMKLLCWLIPICHLVAEALDHCFHLGPLSVIYSNGMAPNSAADRLNVTIPGLLKVFLQRLNLLL